MGNLWPYKNHQYRSKYPIVLLQEHCEKIQFKYGHPVQVYKNIHTLCSGFITTLAKSYTKMSISLSTAKILEILKHIFS